MVGERDQAERQVQVLQERIRQVRELAEAASKPCDYDKTNVCTHEENVLWSRSSVRCWTGC